MKLINSKKIIYIILSIILLISFGVRVYKVSEIPPAISWDEAANGYNAYTIANWGRDEWGNFLPSSFKSFGDDKGPVHIYITSIFVKIFDLSEFSIRLPAAFIGTLNVLLLFLLGRIFFSSNLAALIAAGFLAISPYAIQFSRFNHELQFTIFFFMGGLWLFFVSLDDKGKTYLPAGRFLILSFLSFGISILSYHAAKVVVPVMVFFLITFYFKELWKIKIYFFYAVITLTLLLSIIFFNPALIGISRFEQTTTKLDEIKATDTYKKTGNIILGRLEIMGNFYLAHFAPEYLFISGDPIPRHSIQSVGMFYPVDALFIFIGLVGLIFKKSRITLLLLLWILISPVPATTSGGANGWGHAGRAMFMVGSWHLIAAYGFYLLIIFFKKKYLRVAVFLIGFLVLGFFFKNYLYQYYNNYSKESAIEWQYGMKQIVDYIKENPGYHTVFMTDIRSQPYIFFLFYLKTPLPHFLETVNYNRSATRPSNLVASFDKYIFADWDPIESYPYPNVLYIVGPSHYDGLRYQKRFIVKKRVLFPNGLDAFFIVSQ